MHEPPHHRFGALDLGVVIMMNLMWGLNMIALKNSIDQVGPLTAALLRQGIVLVACLPMLRIIPGQMKGLLWLGFLSGALFYITNNLAFAVSDNVSALAIASQLGAPFSLILAIVFLKERVQKYRIAGMALSFIGVAIVVFDPRVVEELPGVALITLCSFIWAVCSLFQRNFKGVPVLTIYAWVGLIGCLFLLPIAFWFEPQQMANVPNITMATFGWLLFSGIGSTVLGQGAMSWLLQRHPVSTVIPMTLAAPIIAIASSTLYFGTAFTTSMMIGGALALTGVAIVTIRTARAGEKRQEA